MISDWTFEELQEFDDQICEIARRHGLDWYPIIYEICDYYEMIGHMSYHGLPSHYSHWSYGKSFERTHQLYNAGIEGLPYELIINSNPSIAYLMRENPISLQILIMAHCVGHSDFFKNNINFKGTQPDSIIPRVRGAKRRVQEYIKDPSIGIDQVERILDAAHSIRFQVEYCGRQRIPHEKQKKLYLDRIKNSEDQKWVEFDIDKIPIEPDYDILGFIIEHGQHLSEWEKDLLSIVRMESIYFIPQIRTKILNEGWACFWHKKILNELNLPQEYHLNFLRTHNQVVCPRMGRINPYHVGYYLYTWIEKEYGIERCFLVRESMHDEMAIREYLDEKACRDLELFMYSRRVSSTGEVFQVDDVADESGWKNIKRNILLQIGINTIPKVAVVEIDPSGGLILKHDFDGRELDLDSAKKVVQHISTLWGKDVKLLTFLKDVEFEINS